MMILKNSKSLLGKLFKYFSLIFIPVCFAYEGNKQYLASEKPAPLKKIGVTEKLGEFIDLNLQFQTSESQTLTLKKIFQNRPTLLTVVYYNCPTLCNFHLNGLFEAAKNLSQKPGKDYNFVVVTMDATEKPRLALEKKQNYLKEFFPNSNSVYFLTADKRSISKLTNSLGFHFKWSKEIQQFAHSPVAYAISPLGQISRYLYGVEFDKKTLDLALTEARLEKTRDVIDKIRLFCYRFDPKKNQYTLYAYNIMRIGTASVTLLFAIFLLSFWLKKD